jgi:uncharacterized membrane protein HdeD (DUF308 family)
MEVAMENSVLMREGFLDRRWWAVLLRGLIAIAFAVLAFTWPGVTVATLVLLFGFYALADGISSLIAAIVGRHHEDRWLLVLEGIIGIWAGVLTLRAPGLTAALLVFFISIWAMATGFLRIVEAIRLRKQISGELWLALSGVLSILFALMLIIRPVAGALSIVWILAAYVLLLGVFLVFLGVELKRLQPSL